jgi:hypothetical protein
LVFRDWEEFDEAFAVFQMKTFQIFKIRTSKSSDERNKSVVDSSSFIPANKFKFYSKAFLCTHAFKLQFKAQKKGVSQKRRRKTVKYSKCEAKLNATVQPHPDGGFCVRWHTTSGHNHNVSAQLYRYYAEVRLIKDPARLPEVSQWIRVGATAQGMLHGPRHVTGEWDHVERDDLWDDE